MTHVCASSMSPTTSIPFNNIPVNIPINNIPSINSISSNKKSLKDGGIIKIIVNKLLDLIVIEINNAEMKENIQKKIIYPLLYMIYSQLYPYIYTFIIIIILMFLILISLLICFIMYLKK